MRTDIKNEWVKALRSGEYLQTTETLCRVEGEQKSYCCLGVLCDLIQDEAQLKVEVLAIESKLMFDGETSVLPITAQLASGLNTEAPKYSFYIDGSEDDDYMNPLFDDRGSFVELHLASLNDEGFTFDQIADIIEWAEG